MNRPLRFHRPRLSSSVVAAAGFVITGSVNNAAASPFAQSAAFANVRPGLFRTRYSSTVKHLARLVDARR